MMLGTSAMLLLLPVVTGLRAAMGFVNPRVLAREVPMPPAPPLEMIHLAQELISHPGVIDNHIMVETSFTDMADLPEWLQAVTRDAHLDVWEAATDEERGFGLSEVIQWFGLYFLLGGRVQAGDAKSDMTFMEDVKRERRRRSGMSEKKPSLDDVEWGDDWLDDDADDKPVKHRHRDAKRQKK
eukprot:CAMPEP_0118905226 /NCGR_PEP_ID=MMETSP1166-20130328/9340_1 /TAXON_ID=1104430 /ORGANISM="Chrysoreinhardia sp, Strain CCMP3193" /LENGTH=182 /DNA_ID=CAMNT_0006844495 /DNA_START=1 /DNA_END=549 /DNA_ORIENTATION=-